METPRTKNMSLSDYLDLIIEMIDSEPINSDISDGKASMKEVLDEFAKDTSYPPICKRLGRYLDRCKREIKPFENTFHKQQFESLITDKNSLDRDYLAALYLLTAEDKTWRSVREFVSKNGIKYDLVTPVPKDSGYMLFNIARDITDGTKHITLRDIADKNVLTPSQFLLLCKALSISRYGVGAVGIKPRDPREEVVIFRLVK